MFLLPEREQAVMTYKLLLEGEVLKLVLQHMIRRQHAQLALLSLVFGIGWSRKQKRPRVHRQTRPASSVSSEEHLQRPHPTRRRPHCQSRRCPRGAGPPARSATFVSRQVQAFSHQPTAKATRLCCVTSRSTYSGLSPQHDLLGGGHGLCARTRQNQHTSPPQQQQQQQQRQQQQHLQARERAGEAPPWRPVWRPACVSVSTQVRFQQQQGG